MLRQDKLLGEKDQANSSLRTEITRQTEMIEQLKKENEDLQSKNEKFEVDKQELTILLQNFTQSAILMMENHMQNWNKIDSDTHTNSKVLTIMKHCLLLLTLYLNLQDILTSTLNVKFYNLFNHYEAKLEQSLTKDEYTLFIKQKTKFMDAVYETTKDKDKVHKKQFNALAHELILPVYEPHLELIW